MNKVQTKTYFDKSGDEKIFTSNLIENEHGFASYSVDGDVLRIYNVYGDGRHWEKFFTDMAKNNGCTKIRATTKRNPKAFGRSFGSKVVAYVMEKEL